MLTQLVLAFGIVTICLMIHVVGIVFLAERLLKRREASERKPDMTQIMLLLIWVFGVTVLLHLAGTVIWAAFYYWRGLFQDYETSLYFSLHSYTTVGYGDVLLPQRWRLLGCIEGLTGVLLSGLSTAFIFVVLSGLLQLRMQWQVKS